MELFTSSKRVEIFPTGKSGSSDCSAATAADVTDAASPFTRSATCIDSMEGHGFCVYRTYISDVGSSRNETRLTSATTPTITDAGYHGDPGPTCLPMDLRPANAFAQWHVDKRDVRRISIGFEERPPRAGPAFRPPWDSPAI